MSSIEIPDEMNFLIVDTSETYRDSLSMNLRNMGFKNVFSSSNATLGFTNLKEKKIDFIICELNLPELTGIEFLKEIRDSSEIKNKFSFLMMSSEIVKENILLLAEYEIDGYLIKPFSFEQLAKRIPLCLQHLSNPDNVEFIFAEAKQACIEKNFDKSITLYNDILKKHPESSRARLGLGKCFRGLKNFSEAEKFCKLAITKNDIYVQSYDELGQIYLENNKINDAVVYFKKAIELSPKNPMRYEKIADALMEQNRYSEAEEFLEKASSKDVKYSSIYEQYGKALFYQKKIEKAILYFEKVLAIDELNRSVINLLGICLKDLNRYEDALKHYNKAIKTFPTDVKVLYNKSLCYFEMKKYDKAYKTCEYIIKLDPNNEKAKKKMSEIDKILEEEKKNKSDNGT